MIPYLAFWMMISLAGMLADFLIEKEILSIKWTRKVFCLIGKEEESTYTIVFVTIILHHHVSCGILSNR